MNEPWGRLPEESTKAYEAFLLYLNLPVKDRSKERAYKASKGWSESVQHRLPGHWSRWSSIYRWIERAQAYDDYQAEKKLKVWEERRERMRQRDWEQAERLRAIVDGALPNAEQFFRRQTTTIPGTPTILNADGEVIRAGTPAQQIITLAFNVTDLTRVLAEASKLQRLTVNEPTDNINNLTGAALDAALERALSQRALEILPNLRETADVEGASESEADPDPDAE